MSLGELDGVVQHVQLGEWLGMCFSLPVLMNIAHCSAPGIDICRCPLIGVEQAVVQLLQPAREDGVGGSGGGREGRGCSNRRQHTRTALSPDPLADLWPIEIVQVTLASTASRVDGGNALQRRLDTLLPQQLAECVQDDAIADAEEEVEWSGDDALGRDGEERAVSAVEGMLVCWSAIAGGGEEAGLADDADRAWMSGRGGHETENSIEEAPVAVEEGRWDVQGGHSADALSLCSG